MAQAIDHAERSQAQSFVAAVGERVRQARLARAISRKKLAELSDVSERHLAQLESGGGNVSLVLLHRIAAALGRPVDWFVGGDGEADEIGALYRAAPPAQRERVLELLDPGRPARTRRQRI